MPLTDVPFGSLRSREDDTRIPMAYALDASDCVLDADTIAGRPGYRAVTGAGIGSGLTQGVWRFRPVYNAARTIVVRGGAVYAVTDPSTETASDGVATSLGTPFSPAAQISGVQVGKYLYLGSDQSTDTWQRVKSDFTLEAFQSLAKPPDITATPTSLNPILFGNLLAPVVTAGGGTEGVSGVTDWRQLAGSVGGTITYTLDSDVDATGDRWLFISCSPNTDGNGDGSFGISVATGGGAFETVATIRDTPGNDSPYVVYCSLVGVSGSTRSAIRRIRFTQSDTTHNFYASGFMFLPSAPSPGEVTYYITLRDSVTGQESALSDPVKVVYSSDDIEFPQFRAARVKGGALSDLGTISTNPDTFDASSMFNKGAGLGFPTSTEFASVRVFTNAETMPAGPYDKVRLYRVTSTGIRLVKEVDATPGAAPDFGFAVTDDTGDATLSHALYVAGGTPPPCKAIAAMGGRIICGGDPSFPNRLTVSSYLAFGQTTDPFPQFPATPTLTNDGWSVDISPTTAEQILWLGEGDKTLYIGTNEAMYGLNDLTAPLTDPPLFFQILERGPIGRRAAIWAEDRLFWGAFDGIYTCVNRASWEEMTGEERRLFNTWLIPDADLVLGYKNRKLWVIQGQRALRYDFVSNTWTRHHLTHTMQHEAFWRDPTGTIQQLWFLDSDGHLDRFEQANAPDDRGGAIPDWTYSTGFEVLGQRTRLDYLFADVTGPVTINAYKDTSPTGPPAVTWTVNGEHEYAVAPYKASAAGNDATAYKWRLSLTGANTTTVRRLMWQRTEVDARGK